MVYKNPSRLFGGDFLVCEKDLIFEKKVLIFYIFWYNTHVFKVDRDKPLLKNPHCKWGFFFVGLSAVASQLDLFEQRTLFWGTDASSTEDQSRLSSWEEKS
jgi:hypothetical protein